jgi:REP element-mobilizing transposase RayT
MPNHVPLLATPAMPLPKLTKSLQGITSKRANAMRLAREAREYRWSSAGWPTGASAADQGVRPTDVRRL